MLHNTHGSNEAPYTANSSDYDALRHNADAWLKAKLDGYLQWAKTHNSLLLITQDEESYVNHPSGTLTTILTGDPRLVVPGVDATPSTTTMCCAASRICMESRRWAALLRRPTCTLTPPASSPRPGPAGTALTTTSLASSANPSVYGQGIVLTATVASSVAGAPSGMVTFRDGTTSIGTAAVNASGIATLTTGALSVASHAITATYAGDSTYAASTSGTMNQVVNRAGRSRRLPRQSTPRWQPRRSPSRPPLPQPAPGTPTGTVQFVIDGVNSGGPVALVSGKATSAAITSLGAGGHSVTAVYGGDVNFTTSTSATLTQNVSGGVTNNNFASATAISGSSATATGTNVGATKETGEPAHAGNAGGHSVWWTWTAPTTGTVTLDTLGSSFDTLLAVYTGQRGQCVDARSQWIER